MANNTTHINYTLVDIEKYLLGKMNASEMYAMEKAALQDPFLADAIEGFQEANLEISKKYLTTISEAISDASTSLNINYTLTDIEKYLQGNMSAKEMYTIEKAALKDSFLADAMEGYEIANIEASKKRLEDITNDLTRSKVETVPQFNLVHIENYLQGNMSPAEKFAMEKAALQDPFLADAIEGYNETDITSAKKHIDTITTKILGNESSEAKLITMSKPSNNKYWLRIAAAIILMVGVGSTVWLINKKDTEVINPIAQVTTREEIKPDPNIAVPQQLDTNTKQSPATASTIKPIVIAPPTITSAEINSGAGTIAMIDNKKVEEVIKERATNNIEKINQAEKQNKSSTRYSEDVNIAGVTKDVATAPTSPETLQKNNARGDNELRGRVLNNEGLALPNVSVNIDRNSQTYAAAQTDNEGNFTLRSADTFAKAKIASSGYEQQTINLSASRNNIIVLERDPEALSEVVVRASGDKKKREADASTTRSQNISNPSPTPVGGWKSFNDYINAKTALLKNDSTYEQIFAEGEIIVLFKIDNNGKPYSLSTIGGNNSIAINKAIEIVKQGPTWIADKKNKKGKVIIKF